MRAVSILLLLLFCRIGILCAQAQEDAGMLRSQHIYKLLLDAQGDSIHALLNDEARQAVSPLVLGDMMERLEKQFGKLQSAGDWQVETAGDMTLYHCDLQFERYQLRLLLAYDADGRANTIRFIPVPAAAPAAPVTYDSGKLSEREVTVETGGFRLPGTLTLPRTSADGAGRKYPCLVLVHGSGPQDRDETMGSNKPFRDLAWGLAERGVAVLRYDKRTKVYGAAFLPEESEADYDVEVVDDALSAIAMARSLPEVAADSVYVLGHSLGGMLVPRIALRADVLAGAVVLAGPARPLADVLTAQLDYLSRQPGATAADKQQAEEVKLQVANLKKLGTEAFDEHMPLPLGLPRSYWQFDFRYKPVEVARGLSLPMLVLQGERDYQVTMEDFGLWRLGLLRNRNLFFKSYPALNHLFQEGSGPSTPFEYYRQVPVSTEVMDDIVRFIRTARL